MLAAQRQQRAIADKAQQRRNFWNGGDGRVFIYERSGSVWTQAQLFMSPQQTTNFDMNFGNQVRLDGNTLAIAEVPSSGTPGSPRNGTVFTRRGKIVVKNAEWKADERPLDADCPCYTCRNFSRAYLRHLFHAGEILGPRLATLHSLAVYLNLMAEIRASIPAGGFERLHRDFLATYEAGEAERRDRERRR